MSAPGGVETEPRCALCFDAVCANVKLLEDGSWRLGGDGLYHWARIVGDMTIAGGELAEPEVTPIVLAVCGARVLK